MNSKPMNDIMVIDEVPAIALGLQESFRSLNYGVSTTHVENIYTALSSKSYEGKKFDLIIIGDQPEKYEEDPLKTSLDDLLKTVAACKSRFGNSRIMIYSFNYDHAIIEKMEETGIDAYVHKFESIDEIRKAYSCLLFGQRYISGIFHTLYYEYCLRMGKLPPEKGT